MSAPEVAAPEGERPAGAVASRPATLAGLVGGLVGATCCIGPAVGAAMGVGTGSFLLSMSRYRPVTFAVGALVAFAIAGAMFVRRRRSCPTEVESRRLRSRWVDAVLVAFAITYLVGRFVVPPIVERLL